MAKNNFTFQAALKLNSAGFKKGIADVQRSLKGLKNSFLSIAGGLGLGLGFNKLTSSLMDTATKLSVAQNTLRNVSKGVGEYGESMVWLRRISNEYGQDLIGLTNSFAQFRAAADSSNLSLDQMRTIYEALTRAAGAYHMSADRTNDMMNAVTQMLSKGKVAAEELRRQLGNSLPGAFNIMAEAAYDAGLITENSTQALEDAMRSGKIMAEQVLPAFAKRLNDITANADFDSLQTSLNRFKNTWTEVVEAGRFENIFKGLVDSGQRALKFFTDDFFPKMAAGLTGIFGGIAIPKFFKSFVADVRKIAGETEREYNALYASIQAQDQKLAKLKGFKAAQELPVKGRSLGGKMGTLEATAYFISGEELEKLKLSEKEMISLSKAVTKYNDSLLDLSEAQKKLTGKPMFSKASVAGIQEVNDVTKEFTRNLEGSGSAFEDLNGQVNLAATATNKLSMAWRAFKGIFFSALASVAIGAVIGGLTFLITKLIEVRKEAKRIEGIADGMVEKVRSAGGENSKTLIQLTRIKKALEDIDGETDGAKKKALIDEVNNALGRSGDQLLTIEDDIKTKVIPAIDSYISKIKEAAKQQAILSLVNESTSKVIQLEAQNAAYTEDDNYGKTRRVFRHYTPMSPGTYEEELTPEAKKLQDKVDKNNKEIAELNKGIDRIIKSADENTLKAIYGGKETISSGTTSGVTSGNTDSKQATPKSVLDDYRKELQKLENQYKAGAILASDYKNQVETLNEKTFKELASFGWDNVMKRLSKSADKELADELKKSGVDKLLQGLIYDPETVEEADRLIEEEAQKAFEEYKAAWDRYLEYRKKNPTLKSRDADSDYMYSRRPRKGRSFTEYQEQIVNDDLEAYRNYVDDLSSYADDLRKGIKEASSPEEVARLNKLLDQVLTRLQFAKITLKDLKDKANVAQLEKDIEDLRKQGIESIFADITTISNGMDNLYRAIQSVKQINDSTWESEELENFLTVLNAIIQTLEVLKGLYKALQTTEEVYAAIKEKNAQKEIALNGGVALSEEAKAAASAKAAAAGAGAATAGIPVVGPLLAVAAVGSVVAAILSGMKKFATGGYVGGNSYTGDKQLARVNSGELILNPMQQRNLLNLANGKTGQGGQVGEVTFKLRGADIVGSIKNYNRIQRGY